MTGGIFLSLSARDAKGRISRRPQRWLALVKEL